MTTLKKRILTFATLGFFAFSSVGCGYLMHPNRRNGNHTSTLDPMIVLFDVLWFIPGFVPGVVAVIVDSVNGTWYYAPGENPDLVVGSKINKKQTPLKLYAQVPFLIKIKTPIKKSDKITIKMIANQKISTVKTFTANKQYSEIPMGLIIPQNFKGLKSDFLISVNGKRRFSFNAVIR